MVLQCASASVIVILVPHCVLDNVKGSEDVSKGRD